MPGYSQSILAALRRRKYSDDAIRKAISASVSRMESISAGRFELTDREVMRIEDLSDRSGGQLALEGAEFKDDFGLSKVMDAWAEVGKAFGASGKLSAKARRPGA